LGGGDVLCKRTIPVKRNWKAPENSALEGTGLIHDDDDHHHLLSFCFIFLFFFALLRKLKTVADCCGCYKCELTPVSFRDSICLSQASGFVSSRLSFCRDSARCGSRRSLQLITVRLLQYAPLCRAVLLLGEFWPWGMHCSILP